MIQVSGLCKAYGPQQLFEQVTFSINPGERLGVVGRNGHGKSTLFKILYGAEECDAGELHIPDDYRIGQLSQHLQFSEATAVKEACLGLPHHEDGWQETYRAEAVLQGLGFSSSEQQLPPSKLSGGFQVRLNLAKLLLSDPNLLLLDEPTNYLDIVSMRWLSRFLQNWSGELMLITHDHGFMDEVCTHTLGIHRAKIRKVAGSTGKYYEQLALEEEVHEQSRLNQERKRQDAERFIESFRAKASKAKAVQSRIKALERMETVEKLDEIRELDFRFSYQPLPGRRVAELEEVSFGYPGGETLIDGLSINIKPNDRIGVIGKNGRGKSTLLRVLAGELQANQGEIVVSPNVSLGYFGQTNVERLHPALTVEQELLQGVPDGNRTKARSVAGLMMFEGDAALKQVSVLSGGEKSRVLLGKLLLNPANLLLLDEPNNHLDMHSAEALYQAVRSFEGAVVLVTHSEHWLRGLVNRLIVFDRGKAELFEGGYDDFLRRIGWQEEQQPKDRSSERPVLSKKELRKQRAEIIQRRSALLGPLQKQAEALEAEIAEKEQQLEESNAAIIEETKNGFGDAAAKLSRQIHALKERIDACYSELETTLEQLEVQGAEFEQQLQEFE